MIAAAELFEASIDWLRDTYSAVPFHAERDVVWTLQTHLARQIADRHLAYRVFNGFPIRLRDRKLSADLVLTDPTGVVHVAAEFKYEPCHERTSRKGGDIWYTKFPVVFWDGLGSVGEDIKRIQESVAQGQARVAYAVFIDEGSSFRHRPPHPSSTWIDWGNCGDPRFRVAVLWARAPSEDQIVARGQGDHGGIV